jgi:hypothetical protein
VAGIGARSTPLAIDFCLIVERARPSRIDSDGQYYWPAVPSEGMADQTDVKALCVMRTAVRTYARLGAEGHRRPSRPPFERTVESAEFRESQQKRDFGN